MFLKDYANGHSEDGEDVTVRVCEKLEDAIEEVVEGIYLQDLVDWEDDMELNYYI